MEKNTHTKACCVCGMDACSRLKPVPDQLIGVFHCRGAAYSTVQHVSTSPPPMSTGGKLRLLCLHGHRQSGNLFRAKLGGFRRAVRQLADLEFITAPHRVDGLEGEEEGYTWWRSTSEEVDKEMEQESIRVISKAWKQGEYDGLLCFSQGAALGGLLSVLQHTNKLDFRFDFCILVSGFVSDKHREEFGNLGGEQVEVASLHIMGEKDAIIEAARSEELATRFREAKVCLHPEGHYLPYTGDTKDTVTTFLKDRLQAKSKLEQ